VTEQTKKSLLELLRSDPNLRETIFGNASESKAPLDTDTSQMMAVSDTDRAYLARLHGGQSLGQTRDPLAEGRLLEP